jgi:hypothetical protein
MKMPQKSDLGRLISEEMKSYPRYVKRLQHSTPTTTTTTLKGTGRQISQRYSMHGAHPLRRSSFFDQEAMQNVLEETEAKLISTLRNLNGLESNHSNLQVSSIHTMRTISRIFLEVYFNFPYFPFLLYSSHYHTNFVNFLFYPIT